MKGKTLSKVGKKEGAPTYRTPARFQVGASGAESFPDERRRPRVRVKT